MCSYQNTNSAIHNILYICTMNFQEFFLSKRSVKAEPKQYKSDQKEEHAANICRVIHYNKQLWYCAYLVQYNKYNWSQKERGRNKDFLSCDLRWSMYSMRSYCPFCNMPMIKMYLLPDNVTSYVNYWHIKKLINL